MPTNSLRHVGSRRGSRRGCSPSCTAVRSIASAAFVGAGSCRSTTHSRRGRRTRPFALERADLRTQLLAALARLAPIQREIVLLADVEHWPHDRIAQATGISVLMFASPSLGCAPTAPRLAYRIDRLTPTPESFMHNDPIDLTALDPDADPGAEDRFVGAVMGRIRTAPNPYPLQVGVLWGASSLARPVLLAASIAIAAAGIVLVRSWRRANNVGAPRTVAESVGVPMEFQRLAAIESAPTGERAR